MNPFFGSAPLFIRMNRVIKPEEVAGLLDFSHVRVVDVRSAGEYAAGHIPGAVNIPLEELESRLADLEQSGTVVLACQGGRRAGIACEQLTGRHPEVAVLDGGTKAWSAAGLPLVRSVRAKWSLERQVRFGAGLMVLIGVLLGLLVNGNWLYLALFVGAGLTFAGLTDICGMAFVLARLPWNRPSQSQPRTREVCS